MKCVCIICYFRHFCIIVSEPIQKNLSFLYRNYKLDFTMMVFTNQKLVITVTPMWNKCGLKICEDCSYCSLTALFNLVAFVHINVPVTANSVHIPLHQLFFTSWLCRLHNIYIQYNLFVPTNSYLCPKFWLLWHPNYSLKDKQNVISVCYLYHLCLGQPKGN